MVSLNEIVMRTLSDSNGKYVANECACVIDARQNRLSNDTGTALLLNYLQFNLISICTFYKIS